MSRKRSTNSSKACEVVLIDVLALAARKYGYPLMAAPLAVEVRKLQDDTRLLGRNPSAMPAAAPAGPPESPGDSCGNCALALVTNLRSKRGEAAQLAVGVRERAYGAKP